MTGLWTAATDIARNVAATPELVFLAVAGVVISVWVWRIECLNNREN